MVVTHHIWFGIGKTTALKVLSNGMSVKQLGMADTDMDDIVSEATSFIFRCYNEESDGNISEQGYEIWLARIAMASICSAPMLRSLPLTSDAFAHHVYRAHYHTMVWKPTLDS